MRGGFFVVLASLAAGCAAGSEGAAGVEDAPIVAHSDPGHASLPDLGSASRDAASSPADRARVSKHTAFSTPMPFALVACKKNAFCDDFEEATPGARWTSSFATNGHVDFLGPSASFGVHALRATTQGAGGAAYLTRAGASLGKHWAGSLSFAFRIDAVPTSVVGGPEIAVIAANGAVTRIGFSVRPDGIALDQHFETCSGSKCTSRSDLVSDVKPGEWRSFDVGIETGSSTTPPYGRIEVTVDHGDRIELPLTVTPFDGKAEAHAGITVPDVVPATTHVDDVMFELH
jgi:hypothetical protein